MTRKTHIHVILSGDITDVEQNIDMILQHVSYIDLDETYVQISNEEVKE